MSTTYVHRSKGDQPVIHLSRLHGAGSIVINADLIETIEACPDTTITLMTKRKFVVADALDDVVDKIVTYRRRVNAAFIEGVDEAGGEQSETPQVAAPAAPDTASRPAGGSPPPPMGGPAKTLSLDQEAA